MPGPARLASDVERQHPPKHAPNQTKKKKNQHIHYTFRMLSLSLNFKVLALGLPTKSRQAPISPSLAVAVNGVDRMTSDGSRMDYP